MEKREIKSSRATKKKKYDFNNHILKHKIYIINELYCLT